jgi:hypothetical protein
MLYLIIIFWSQYYYCFLGGQNLYFSSSITQILRVKLLNTTYVQHCYFVAEKPYTMAGFEPGSFVPQANAMTSVPGRQGILLLSSSNNFFNFFTFSIIHIVPMYKEGSRCGSAVKW